MRGGGRTRRPFAVRAARLLLGGAAAAAALCALWVAAYRFLPPPTTALIEAERARLGSVSRDWVPLASLPAHVPLAMLGAEDARFCAHWGFDLDAIRAAMASNAEGGRVRGASTLTQQVAKNAFLWPGRTWTRKAFEGGFSVLIEALWPKRRIVEIYLNIAEMGEGVFGIEAAAQAHFRKPAAKLTAREAALIAAALPAPKDRRPGRPSAFMQRRAASIQSSAETLAATGDGACALPRAAS